MWHCQWQFGGSRPRKGGECGTSPSDPPDLVRKGEPHPHQPQKTRSPPTPRRRLQEERQRESEDGSAGPLGRRPRSSPPGQKKTPLPPDPAAPAPTSASKRAGTKARGSWNGDPGRRLQGRKRPRRSPPDPASPAPSKRRREARTEARGPWGADRGSRPQGRKRPRSPPTPPCRRPPAPAQSEDGNAGPLGRRPRSSSPGQKKTPALPPDPASPAPSKRRREARTEARGPWGTDRGHCPQGRLKTEKGEWREASAPRPVSPFEGGVSLGHSAGAAKPRRSPLKGGGRSPPPARGIAPRGLIQPPPRGQASGNCPEKDPAAPRNPWAWKPGGPPRQRARRVRHAAECTAHGGLCRIETWCAARGKSPSPRNPSTWSELSPLHERGLNLRKEHRLQGGPSSPRHTGSVRGNYPEKDPATPRNPWAWKPGGPPRQRARRVRHAAECTAHGGLCRIETCCAARGICPSPRNPSTWSELSPLRERGLKLRKEHRLQGGPSSPRHTGERREHTPDAATPPRRVTRSAARLKGRLHAQRPFQEGHPCSRREDLLRPCGHGGSCASKDRRGAGQRAIDQSMSQHP